MWVESVSYYAGRGTDNMDTLTDSSSETVDEHTWTLFQDTDSGIENIFGLFIGFLCPAYEVTAEFVLQSPGINSATMYSVETIARCATWDIRGTV